MKVNRKNKADNSRIDQYEGRQYARLLASLLVLLLISMPVLGEKRQKGRALDFVVTPVIDVGEAPVDVAVIDLDLDHNLDLIVANALSQNLSIFTGNDTGQFYLRYTIDGLYGRLLAGDFNNDGQPDLLVLDSVRNQLQVLLNESDMRLSPQPPLRFYEGVRSLIGRALALGDFNGDNLLDVAKTMIGADGGWQLLLVSGMGNGRLLSRLAVPLERPPVAIAALDANRDGITDIAIADIQGLSLILGNSRISQIRAQKQMEHLDKIQGRLIVTADFDLDGNSDLAVIGDEGNFWILSGNGQGGFEITQKGKERRSFNVAIADDFNGDGRPDLALVRNIGDVALLQSDVSGKLTATAYFTLSGSNTLAAVAADLNSDGYADLITANTNSNTVSLLYGRADGFASTRHYLVDEPVAQLISSDFNGDGLLDLAVTEQNAAGKIRIFDGDGRGGFTPAGSIAAQPFPGGFTSADLDGDKLVDLIYSSSSTDQIGVLLSSRGLDNMLMLETGNQHGSPGDIVVGDFDSDSLPDIAVANSNALDGTNNITIFFGPGTYKIRVENLPLGAVPHNLVAGDFNGDGITDLVTDTCCSEESLLVLLGVRGGAMQPQRLILPERSFRGLAAADFDHDAITDISFIDTINQHVVILSLDRNAQPAKIERVPLKSPFQLQPADINNDGNIDLIALCNDLAVVLLGNGDGNFILGPAIRTGSVHQLVVGDFNRDGKNDLVFAGKDYIEPIISQKGKK